MGYQSYGQLGNIHIELHIIGQALIDFHFKFKESNPIKRSGR